VAVSTTTRDVSFAFMLKTAAITTSAPALREVAADVASPRRFGCLSGGGTLTTCWLAFMQKTATVTTSAIAVDEVTARLGGTPVAVARSGSITVRKAAAVTARAFTLGKIAADVTASLASAITAAIALAAAVVTTPPHRLLSIPPHHPHSSAATPHCCCAIAPAAIASAAIASAAIAPAATGIAIAPTTVATARSCITMTEAASRSARALAVHEVAAHIAATFATTFSLRRGHICLATAASVAVGKTAGCPARTTAARKVTAQSISDPLSLWILTRFSAPIGFGQLLITIAIASLRVAAVLFVFILLAVVAPHGTNS
jgi:hypothetical protein